MKGIFFISRRLSAKSGLAVVSVAISAVVMLIALFVSSGFRSAIQGSISAVSGDMAVLSPYMDIMSEKHYVRCTDEYKDLISGCPGVKRVSPSIYRAGIVKSGTGISGVVFKGVDSTYDFSMLSGRLVEGSFPVLRKGRISTEAAIPLSLAQEAGIGLGDTFLAYFIGEEVKARRFRVCGIYRSPIEEQEGNFVFSDLENLRRLNGWDEESVSAIEIFLKKGEEPSEVSGEVSFIVFSYSSADDPSAIVYETRNRFPSIFDWLDLLDFNLYAVLVLMFAVSGFNMVSGILIILFENMSSIGLFKALGMKNREIAKVFMAKASSIVLKGLAIGNVIAFALGILQDSTQFIKLNPENYIVDSV
ncbi:MAG: ABC transporter permease, partial [Muribaculum sp.]|nr:ABC transporter permease [Candidatus Merdivivens faecigallinarum]